MCDEHVTEDPLLEDLKNILTGTNIKITGVGYNEDADETLFKLEMVINGKSVASLSNIVDEFNTYMDN